MYYCFCTCDPGLVLVSHVKYSQYPFFTMEDIAVYMDQKLIKELVNPRIV